ncbi:MiaB/RimO family radical SAM methylthiotransferase [Kiritimatiella glycovorans]|uniref:Threonylcarbamoyladenosine tRNA methylthiotransferase MtaB n=1 Tax=Kiritimatiella glycovorans TaxID=1307763 RepID=A0A0G3EN33_9BACT|nr:MiaB/RimO family radical SAM methylthiotransferase [Kiritimatiella glycovorans]AKJ65559.1 Threonylcarbamoyladenosine tRNA methylthiotransferase MtaB [Kiritimatiella glycovorans]
MTRTHHDITQPPASAFGGALPFRVRVLGCKVNQCEAEEIRGALSARGLREAGRGESTAVAVLHSCAVTAEAVRKTRQALRRLAKEEPDRLLLSGCAAGEALTGELKPDPVRVPAGPGWRERLETALDGAGLGRVAGGPVRASDPRQIRAFLKIQDGCDLGCAYCIVPSLRGTPRDRPPGEVLAEARELAGRGHREIVVTGISVGLYGRDGGYDLREVLDPLTRMEDVARVRLSSLHPSELTDPLLEFWSRTGKLMPHVHLPLQSGSDAVLAAMGRGYDGAQFRAAVARMRAARENPAITTDVIVGFPGETEADFARTMELCRGTGFSRMHVFPFSVRPGTRAAKMGRRVSPDETARRAARLRALGAELSAAYHAQFEGREVRVLLERTVGESASGLRPADFRGMTERYVPAECRMRGAARGQVATVRVKSSCGEGVTAEEV